MTRVLTRAFELCMHILLNFWFFLSHTRYIHIYDSSVYVVVLPPPFNSHYFFFERLANSSSHEIFFTYSTKKKEQVVNGSQTSKCHVSWHILLHFWFFLSYSLSIYIYDSSTCMVVLPPHFNPHYLSFDGLAISSSHEIFFITQIR